MVNRKLEEKYIRDLMNNAKIIFSASPLPEIDSIMEDRLSGDLIGKKKRKYPSNIANDRNKVENPINKLPEELLSLISSFLTMREAASMGILARWCWYLWRTREKLNFDHRNMTGEISPTVDFRTLKFRFLQEKRCTFVRWVHQILKLHCGPTIESFRMAYNLGEDHYSDIDQWVQSAINKGVQKLDIDLSPELDIDLSPNIFPETSIPYEFPHWLFTKGKHGTLKHLSLRSCSMDLPRSFGNFSSLASLTLKKATLTQERVQNILSNCSCLRWFSITLCDCPLLLKFWGGGPSLKLKHLNISACYRIQEIEIHDAVDIASFEYMGNKLDRLLFKNSGQLKRLCYCTEFDPLAGVSYALGHLASDFPQLETLLLTSPRFKENMIPEQLPTFSKLKELVLQFIGSHKKGLLGMTSTLLKASPLLGKLELHLPTTCCSSKKVLHKKMARVRHENLKQVEMYNFQGVWYEVELAVYLLKSSTALETIKVGRDWRGYCCDGEWQSVRVPYGIKRKQAYRLLRRNVPSSIKLIVL